MNIETLREAQADMANRVSILIQQFHEKTGLWPNVSVDYVDYSSLAEERKFPRVSVNTTMSTNSR